MAWAFSLSRTRIRSRRAIDPLSQGATIRAHSHKGRSKPRPYDRNPVLAGEIHTSFLLIVVIQRSESRFDVGQREIELVAVALIVAGLQVFLYARAR